jgi:predicted RNA-binding protein (virulence factor B family)
MKIGLINKLKVKRITDMGFYLVDEENDEVFLSNTPDIEKVNPGDEINAFVYKDLDNRTVATTAKPDILLDHFAFLKVSKTKKGDVFMDWGMPDDLLVPGDEQSQKMLADNWYLIFLLKDEETGNLIGSNKVNDFVFFDEIDLKKGEEVDLLLYKTTDLGMNAIVNNLYKGLIFTSDIHKNINPGERLKGYVKEVREDGNIDLLLEPLGYKGSIDKNSKIILDALSENDGFLELNDKSAPEDIKFVLGLSKKAFKRSLGNLYKQKLVEIYKDGIKLL